MAARKKTAKKTGERQPVAARETARRQELDEAAADAVDASLKVAFSGGVHRFAGDGYNTARPSVMLHYGDGTHRRVGTVDGVMDEAVHEYPVGSFTAWTEYGDGERLASCKVSVKAP